MGKVFHAYGMADKWTMSSRCFDGANCVQFTAELVKAVKFQFDKSKNPQPVTRHDPCNFGRSRGIVEEPLAILEATCQDFREMMPNRADNWCCGGGGGLSAIDDIIDFRMEISGTKKLEQVRDTGAEHLATACSNCKHQLTQLTEHHRQRV